MSKEERVTLLHGDCLEVMPTLAADSVDSIVSDPPYGLSFMGKNWDHGVPGQSFWAEALRVAKPGAHLLAFGGTRTYHRLACAIEDAGWEIRDCVMWVYGSGFPKSLDVSKAIDKAAGCNRPRVLGGQGGVNAILGSRKTGEAISGEAISGEAISGEAKQWQGWGTALKPSWEPIIIGYRPLTVEQFIGIITEKIRGQLCQCLPANDVEKSFIATQAKSSEVAHSVPENVRIYELENSGNVKFVARRFTCPSHELSVGTDGSALMPAKGNGNQKIPPEIETLLGRVADFLSQVTDIFTSGTTENISVNTVLSWNVISDELLKQASMFTTLTGIKLTTALRTLRSFLSQIISDDIGNLSLDISPAYEPIIVARKPLDGTVAENVLTHGTGGINVDGCRVGRDTGDVSGWSQSGSKASENRAMSGGNYARDAKPDADGRWPANLIHDGSDEVVGLFPSTGASKATPRNNGDFKSVAKGRDLPHVTYGHDDNGGSAARFFYCAKASKADRDEGLEDFALRSASECCEDREPGSAGLDNPRAGAGRTSGARNIHPTVKPTSLMRYLCRLVTPPNGVILDPFMGSGSTGKGAMLEGFRFIGIEREAEYLEIARARINHQLEKVLKEQEKQGPEQLNLID
jgi:DNA modification methylase